LIDTASFYGQSTVTIALPIPPKCLNPNVPANWRKKAESTKKYRAEAAMVTKSELIRYSVSSVPWKKSAVRVRWFYVNRPDKDNVIAWMKSGFDGIADAGVVENDRFLEFLPVEIVPVKSNPN